MSYKYKYHTIRRDFFNFSLLIHRGLDAVIITMHQSGTHWLHYMLTLALTKKLGIEGPKSIHNELFFERPSTYHCDHEVPRVASAHTVPTALVGSKLFNRILRFPNYLILVRDMRSTLVSHFEKHKSKYVNPDFSTFLRGDVSNKQFRSDIWWHMRFYNAWGRIAANMPEGTMIVRYEDLKTDTYEALKNISDFLNLELSDEHLQYGINEATKDNMKAKSDPSMGNIVRKDDRNPLAWFSEDDKQFFIDTCKDNLKYDFGYNFYDMS